MPFGLRNAGQTFQRLMDAVVRGLDGIFVYLDDILVPSPNAELHSLHLHDMFKCLQDNGLVVRPFWAE